MQKIIVPLFAALVSVQANAQSRTVTIKGDVKNSRGILQVDLPICLIENSDTIAVAKTNEIGGYFFEAVFLDSAAHSLRYGRNKVQLPESYDTIRITDFRVDLIVPNVCTLFENSAYYKQNSLVYDGFSLAYMRQILLENPDVCFEFNQTINVHESLRTARRRMKRFEQTLASSGINTDEIIFSRQVFRLDKGAEDQRSRIEGKVASLDCKCGRRTE